jgi:hypothetical protein
VVDYGGECVVLDLLFGYNLFADYREDYCGSGDDGLD